MTSRICAAVPVIVALVVAVVGAVGSLSSGAPAVAQTVGVCGPNPSPPNPADPSMQVYAPVPEVRSASPLRVAGQARVFEATVSLELRDAGGRTIAEGFTTAAQGAPALAPFEGSLRFTVNAETPACLWVFEASARDGSPVNVVQVPVTLVPSDARYVESALYLGELRPCIPATGLAACDAVRLALWNGEAQAWAGRGVTDPDARFNETVVFRVREGDPAAIRNIARILGWPYLQITRLHFGGTGQGQADDFIEVTNLGGGAQDLTGWTLRSPSRNAVFRLPAGVILRPGQICRLLTGRPLTNPGGECRAFTTTDQIAPSGGESLVDVWPDDAGEAVLFFDRLDLLGDETRYDAGPASQPPPPNLQGTVIGMQQPPVSAFEFVLSTAKPAYATGEQVTFEMALRNRSGQQQTLTFLGGQDFDIVVTDANAVEVWRWSTGRAFTQQLRNVTFAPGEERRFSATWDQRSDAGQQVPAGGYQAVATTATSESIRSNAVTFRIEPAPPGGVEFTLSTPRNVYAAGEAIPFEMVLRNRSTTQPAMLTFPSGQDFDVVVSSADGREVWRWSAGRFFTQVVRDITLAPGEERRFSATWDQRTDAGSAAPAGAYQATAVLTTQAPITSNSVDLRIR
jgi:hypothetical protein